MFTDATLRLVHSPTPLSLATSCFRFFLSWKGLCFLSFLLTSSPSESQEATWVSCHPPRCAETSGAETNEKIILSVKVLDVLSATPKQLLPFRSLFNKNLFGVNLLDCCKHFVGFSIGRTAAAENIFWGGWGKKTQNQLKMWRISLSMAEAWNKNEYLLTALNHRVSFAMLQSIRSFSRVFYFFNENIMVWFCSSHRTNEVHISPETFSSLLFSSSKR